MDESVIIGNIVRVVENLCHDELITLNRGIGHLLGKSGPRDGGESARSRRRSSARSRGGASARCKTDGRIKFQILKELNQAPLGEIAAIYADLNRHLANLRVMQSRRPQRSRADERRAAPAGAAQAAPPSRRMALFRRWRPGSPAAGNATCMRRCSGVRASHGGFPLSRRTPACRPRASIAPMPPTPSGYVPGAPIISTPGLHEGLTRLQAGQTELRRRGHAGRVLRHSGGPAQRPARPAGIAARPAREPARVDDDRDGRDAVRLHLRDEGPARRHQGAARAAADPGAEGRDARRRVLREEDASRRACSSTRSPQAGLGWSPAMGQDDPLYRKIDRIVHRDPRRLRRQPRASSTSCARSSRRSSPTEEQAAEANIATTAEEINAGDRKDRRERRREVRNRAAHRELSDSALPRAVPAPEVAGRARGRSTCSDGEDSDAWSSASPRSRISCGACSRRRRPRTASTWSRCCRRC